MTNSTLETAIDVARALSNPARLRVVAMLRSGDLCPCQITEVLGLAASTVSLHLKELRRAGLVSERKQGRWVFFAIAEDPLVQAWIMAALGPIAQDPQLVVDRELVDDLRRLSVDDLCKLGYEAAKAKASTAHTG
ncbi:MAG: winged helix-turn-helix transcriptional regulator [bacterium]|nr:winged helix-turn-helix transcriptional regulator [bacterium]